MPRPRGMIYLLHFHRPLHHARHYLGWTQDLPGRLASHAANNGSALMGAIGSQRIGWSLVRTWLDKTHKDERRLKRRHNTPRECPVCNPEVWRPHARA